MNLIFTSTSLYTTQSISLISMDNLTSSKRCLRFLKETIYNLSPLNFREFDVDELPCQEKEEGASSIRNLSLFFVKMVIFFLYQMYDKIHFLVTLKIISKK